MLHLVLASHLLHEELRVCLDPHFAVPVRDRISQRGEQPVVFRDVVGRDSEAAVQFLDQRAVIRLDADPVAGRAGVAARAAVDIRRNHALRGESDVQEADDAVLSDGVGAK